MKATFDDVTNFFRGMVDVQTIGAAFLEGTLARKPHHSGFPTRRRKNRNQTAEPAICCLITS